MSMVADTDVLIDFLAGRDPAASRIAIEHRSGALRTTTISRFERLEGARTARQKATILELLDAIPALAPDVEAADRAAEVRRALERSGRPIGMGDSLIAGIVIATGGILITGNRTHFERVDGLRLSGSVGRD